ncbi:MAG: MogA/MoaB family molybdenum cofactor biosynthesis protein [Eubacteriales bacterium]|nr:MogA/MoaB family molybdenum cofactor biosynthesis protein [Eubacteriales bacterium]
MYNVAILVSSDSSFNGTREDLSGPKMKEILEKSDEAKGILKVTEMKILPDEKNLLCEYMKEKADNEDVNLILTTGGTGFSNRDVMPEATKDVIEKEVLGIPEAMRLKSLEITTRAMLSRGVAGIRNNTLIINMPGSPKAIEEMLSYVLPAVIHGLDILLGNTKNCARK